MLSMPSQPNENLDKVCDNSRSGESPRLRLGFSLICSQILPKLLLSPGYIWRHGEFFFLILNRIFYGHLVIILIRKRAFQYSQIDSYQHTHKISSSLTGRRQRKTLRNWGFPSHSLFFEFIFLLLINVSDDDAYRN